MGLIYLPDPAIRFVRAQAPVNKDMRHQDSSRPVTVKNSGRSSATRVRRGTGISQSPEAPGPPSTATSETPSPSP